MARGTTIRFALLAGLCALLASPPMRAQSRRRWEKCLPYPTLAQEIQDMRDEIDRLERRPTILDSVRIEGGESLSATLREQIIDGLKARGEFDGNDNWLDELQEIGVRGPLQDHGYFNAQVHAVVQPVDGEASPEKYSVTIYIDEGKQYRLGKVVIRSIDPDRPLRGFTAPELRKLIPLREGEIFNTEKIREALEAMREAYGSKGFIDFTTEPLTQVDEKNGRISLTLSMDEQMQFRLGKIEVLATNPTVERILKSQFKPGQVFDNRRFDAFFREYKALLPDGAGPEDVEFTRDLRSGKVNLRFEFRTWTCPELQN